jgi:CBS domain containing-hemolysin-like protein
MIASVFALGDTVAREVMVPRTAMVWVPADMYADEAEQVALRSGFSRIPVVGEDLDDVRGVVYLKDLVRLDDRVNPHVSEVMRAVSFVPDSKPVDDLLREMQTARIHIATVVDEYGGTAGLITIEDILEEIVGEITDEYDNELPPVAWLDDRTARVTARLSVQDLEELFGVSLPELDVDTVAGLLAAELGKVPLAGDRARLGGLELTAEGTVGRRNRIETVRVARLPETGDAPAAAVNDERHKINV